MSGDDPTGVKAGFSCGIDVPPAIAAHNLRVAFGQIERLSAERDMLRRGLELIRDDTTESIPPVSLNVAQLLRNVASATLTEADKVGAT